MGATIEMRMLVRAITIEALKQETDVKSIIGSKNKGLFFSI